MKRKLAAIAILFHCFLFSRDAAAGVSAITGSATGTNYAEWQGVVGLILEGRYVCTATLIAPDTLVTAAHCLYSTKKGYDYTCADVAVTGGSHLVNAPVTVGLCAEIRLHESWTGAYEDGSTDLALIRLSASAAQEHYPLRTDDTALDEEGVIVGYGFLDPDDSSTLAYHRKGNTRIIGKEIIYSMQLIELGGEAGTCAGDSGGPFFSFNNDRYELTGVTTAGKGSDCSPTSGNMDIDLPAYVEWIVENAFALNGNCLDDLCSTSCKCPEGKSCEKNRCIGEQTPDEDAEVSDEETVDENAVPDETFVPDEQAVSDEGGEGTGTTDDQDVAPEKEGTAGGCSLVLSSGSWVEE